MMYWTLLNSLFRELLRDIYYIQKFGTSLLIIVRSVSYILLNKSNFFIQDKKQKTLNGNFILKK